MSADKIIWMLNVSCETQELKLQKLKSLARPFPSTDGYTIWIDAFVKDPGLETFQWRLLKTLKEKLL